MTSLSWTALHDMAHSFLEQDKAVVHVDWLVFCDCGFCLSALWCPLSTSTILLCFLRLPHLRRGVSHHSPFSWSWVWGIYSRPWSWPWTWGISFQLLSALAPHSLHPRSVGAQYSTVDQWRNNSRKNEETEAKQKQHPVVDVTGDGSKVRCCKEQ